MLRAKISHLAILLAIAAGTTIYFQGTDNVNADMNQKQVNLIQARRHHKYAPQNNGSHSGSEFDRFKQVRLAKAKDDFIHAKHDLKNAKNKKQLMTAKINYNHAKQKLFNVNHK